jgi:hypothetical protein
LVYGRDGGACQPTCLDEDTKDFVWPPGGSML